MGIVERPIRFGQQRVDLTLRYIRKHYGLNVASITIKPVAVVVHWTGTRTSKAAWRIFDPPRRRTSRRHLSRGGALNVSAHYLVSRKGRVFRLMPENWMARHCIGLNYDSLAIENVGGQRWPLTQQQLAANAGLIRDLLRRHAIRYLLGHMEWRRFERAPFFRERNPTLRNAKVDPGRSFMERLRVRLADLRLRSRYHSN